MGQAPLRKPAPFFTVVSTIVITPSYDNMARHGALVSTNWAFPCLGEHTHGRPQEHPCPWFSLRQSEMTTPLQYTNGWVDIQTRSLELD